MSGVCVWGDGDGSDPIYVSERGMVMTHVRMYDGDNEKTKSAKVLFIEAASRYFRTFAHITSLL